MSELVKDCGRLAVDPSGACRQRLLHPDEFECGRCHGAKVEHPPSAPKRAAKRVEWIEWAVAVGARREEAGALSRDELIEQYGGMLGRYPADVAAAEAIKANTPATDDAAAVAADVDATKRS
ncbi:MAG: hypothetical protein WKF64_07280 [Ilumatobacteraceae bacterium]